MRALQKLIRLMLVMTSNSSPSHSQRCHLLYRDDPLNATKSQCQACETCFVRLRFQSLRFTLQMSFTKALVGYCYRESLSSSCQFGGPHDCYGNFKRARFLAHALAHDQDHVILILSQSFRRQPQSSRSSYFSRCFAL